jgi:hypothetical protein
MTTEDVEEGTEANLASKSQYFSLTREMIEVFENFQRSRMEFARQTVELSDNTKNASLLQRGGAIELLKPLLLDPLKSIRINAALALGKLASSNEENAKEIAKEDVLHQLLFTLTETVSKQTFLK